MKKIYTLISSLFLGQMFAQSTLVSDNFNYPASSALTENGWYAHSGGTTNPILVGANGLSWPGYIGSDIGNSASVANTGQDVNRPFNNGVSSGAVYASFLVQVNAPVASTGQGVFLHLGYYDGQTPNGDFSNLATAFRGRTFVLQGTDANTQFKLGLSFNATTASAETNNLNIGETYLVVLKYQFLEGDLNDVVSMYVFAQGADISEEPANPNIGPLTGTQTDAPSLQAIALRQFDAAQNVVVDGIYVKDAWDIEACIPTTGTDTRTECAGYEWIDGNTYDESNNTATFLIVGGAANGCDSLVTLNLTIVQVNTNVTVSGNTLTSSASEASYQWINCAGNTPIDEATNVSYTPEVSGSYAVQVTQTGCSATSDCVPVTLVSIENNVINSEFTVYPNPNKGQFTLSWNSEQHVSISVINVMGQTVLETSTTGANNIDLKISSNSGVYFLVITDGNGLVHTLKVVVD